ncbi:MAG: carboxypeptidase regulatory-like domain-containing protein [Chitinophagales bacterium]|nr:carboxypeptidase regulatory-like domain-containing protein [Chitinophagales bacterium]
MEKKNENSISMFKTVKAVCETNIAVINANVGLNNTYNQYLLLLSNLELLAQEQTLNRTGITIDKKNAREALALLVEGASGIIKAHFDSVSNYDVFVSVNLSFTKLRIMRDQLFIAHTQTVINLLTTHQAVLAPFGVDAAYITNISNALTQYINIVAKPTEARNNKSTATLLLKTKIKEIATFLKNELDNAMLVVKITNTSFYVTFRNARRIIDNGIRHEETVTGTITGVVKDETNNQVIPDALVEIVGTPTIVLTDNLGEFTIISIPPETYTIRVSIGNYDIKLIDNIIVTANENTQVEIKLTPSA